jgi:hypothetical protein
MNAAKSVFASAPIGRWESVENVMTGLRRHVCDYFSDVDGRLEFVWWRDCVVTFVIFWFSASDFFPTFLVRQRCLLLCSEAEFWVNCLRLMRVISSRLIRSWSIDYTDQCLFSQVYDCDITSNSSNRQVNTSCFMNTLLPLRDTATIL